MAISKMKAFRNTVSSMLLAIIGVSLLVVVASANINRSSNGMEIVAPLNIKMDVAAIVTHLDSS